VIESRVRNEAMIQLETNLNKNAVFKQHHKTKNIR